MEGWRPIDWDEIKPETAVLPTSGEKSSFVDGFNIGVERGADAILEALEERGYRVDTGEMAITWDSKLLIPSNSKGLLVFIPEVSE